MHDSKAILTRADGEQLELEKSEEDSWDCALFFDGSDGEYLDLDDCGGTLSGCSTADSAALRLFVSSFRFYRYPRRYAQYCEAAIRAECRSCELHRGRTEEGGLWGKQ